MFTLILCITCLLIGWWLRGYEDKNTKFVEKAKENDQTERNSKISESLKGNIISEETRRKLSVSVKKYWDKRRECV